MKHKVFFFCLSLSYLPFNPITVCLFSGAVREWDNVFLPPYHKREADTKLYTKDEYLFFYYCVCRYESNDQMITLVAAGSLGIYFIFLVLFSRWRPKVAFFLPFNNTFTILFLSFLFQQIKEGEEKEILIGRLIKRKEEKGGVELRKRAWRLRERSAFVVSFYCFLLFQRVSQNEICLDATRMLFFDHCGKQQKLKKNLKRVTCCIQSG